MSCERCEGDREATLHRPDCPNVVNHPAMSRAELGHMVRIIRSMHLTESVPISLDDEDTLLTEAINRFLKDKTLSPTTAARQVYCRKYQ